MTSSDIIPTAHEAAPSLAYAPAQGRNTARAVAGASILVAGLVLIGLGGCFLIGVMLLLTGNALGFTMSPSNWGLGHSILLITLYACAFACFAGAVFMFAMALRMLFSAVKS